MIELPSTESLLARERRLANGRLLHYFPSTASPLVKLDVVFEAGSAYQREKLCAAAACKLSTAASASMDARRVAEFMDFRGIVVESNPDTLVATTSFYTLRRYLPELLPLVDDLLRHPAFAPDDFEPYMARRRTAIMTEQRRTSSVVRRMFYEALFGPDHALGRYAEPADAERLGLDEVRRFYGERCHVGDMRVVLAGDVDEALLDSVDRLWGHDAPSRVPVVASLAAPERAPQRLARRVEGAVQSTVRMGRILPLRWDDPDYAQVMLLTTLLGGYFGSRLMSNIREEKGLTYGIYARTQIFRGAIVFIIQADVAEGAAERVVDEVAKELDRLAKEPVGEDELEMVRTVMASDFIRSVDGLMERSTRLCDMLATGVDERLTDNLRAALRTATPESLQAVAARFLSPGAMTVCVAGA